MNKKSVGVAGNNAESTSHPYNQVINNDDLITVWGHLKNEMTLLRDNSGTEQDSRKNLGRATEWLANWS